MTPSQSAIHRRKTELGPMFWHLLLNKQDARSSMVAALEDPQAVPQLVAQHLEGCFRRNEANWSKVGLFLQQMMPTEERKIVCDIVGSDAPEFGVKREQPRQQQRQQQRQQRKTGGSARQNAGSQNSGTQKSAREKAMDEAMAAMRAARERMGFQEHPFASKAGGKSEGFQPFRTKKAASKTAPKPIWDKDFLTESNVQPDWTGSAKLRHLDQAVAIGLAKRVAEDKDMQAAKDNWSRMSDSERLAIVDKLVGWHAELAGFPKPPVEAVQIAPHKNPQTGEKTVIAGQACVTPDQHAIMINTHPESYFDKMPIVLMNAVHEGTHILQATMGDRLRNGEVYSNEEDWYKDHVTMYKGVRGMYKDARDNQTDYENQPVEIHARRVEETFVRHYIDLCNGKAIRPDPSKGRRPKFQQF
ncbi:MAG: hypothetical protein Alpg2KO_19270 [Alphaproteobacteria bacterium]